MNREEFKKFVIEEAKKYIFTPENEAPAVAKESVDAKSEPVSKKELDVTPDEVKNLAEEIGKINKNVDFRNPFTFDESEIVSESVKASKPESIKPSEKIQRYDDMHEYNKKKDSKHINESEKDKWQRILNYKIPGDTDR